MEKGLLTIIFICIWTYSRVQLCAGDCYTTLQGVECVISCWTNTSAVYQRDCGGRDEPIPKLIVTNANPTSDLFTEFRYNYGTQEIRHLTLVDLKGTTFERGVLQYFINCYTIDVSNNHLSNLGVLTFNGLLHLKTLNASHNEISIIERYVEDQQWLLKVLDLSYNDFSHLENFDDYMPDLHSLFINNNNVDTISDTFFNNCPNLKKLCLKNNNLSAINLTLTQLEKLEKLDLSYNKLKLLPSNELNGLRSLTSVDFSNNQIEYMSLDCFLQSPNLEDINLRNNKVNSPINHINFMNNIHLLSLDLFNNSISTVSRNSFRFTSLRYINLTLNQLCGDLEMDTFIGLNNVTSMDLSSQNISGINNFAFNNMTSIVSLNLSKNHIVNVGQFSFATCDSLRYLDASYNYINDLAFIRNMTSEIVEIKLKSNKIAAIKNETFNHHDFLITLDLSDNLIISIQPFSLPLKKLQYLHLTGNRLGGIIRKNTFSPAKYLRFLTLSHMKFLKVENDSFLDMPVLSRLDISKNNLQTIEPRNFISMNNLQLLDLSFNNISVLVFDDCNLKKLRALFLSNNKIRKLGGSFNSATQLMYLDVENNSISSLSDIPFEYFGQLSVALLASNNITYFNIPTINNLSRLARITLSHNNIKFIELSYFRDLVSIDLAYNHLHYLNKTFFLNITRLQSLDISGNKISKIVPGTFKDLELLKLLNLSHNLLSNLRYGSFKGLHKTEVLDLSYNRLDDFEVDIIHECKHLQTLIVDYNKLRSFDVERLVHMLPTLSSLSIGGNLMSCKQIVRDIESVNRSPIRQVDVTSMHEILHEDNVKGITCGQLNKNESLVNASPIINNSLYIWCSISTLLLIVFVLTFALKRIYFDRRASFEPMIQLKDTLSLSNTSLPN